MRNLNKNPYLPAFRSVCADELDFRLARAEADQVKERSILVYQQTLSTACAALEMLSPCSLSERETLREAIKAAFEAKELAEMISEKSGDSWMAEQLKQLNKKAEKNKIFEDRGFLWRRPRRKQWLAADDK